MGMELYEIILREVSSGREVQKKLFPLIDLTIYVVNLSKYFISYKLTMKFHHSGTLFNDCTM